MSEFKSIRYCLLLAALCFAAPAYAQAEKGKDKTATVKGKNAAPEKDSGASEGEEAAEEEVDDAAPAETTEEAEEEAGDEAEEDEDDSEEDEALEEGEDDAAAEEETPAAPALDMSALGAIDPEKDLAKAETIEEGADAGKPAEDWTERAMDILELHGYFRVRPELYHKFNIRQDDALYNRTAAQAQDDDAYKNNTLAGANMRFRLEPTLNISEEIRIKTQIDFLDNVMLGSTPRYYQRGYGYGTADSQMLQIGRVQGWDMGPPGSEDMVHVRRVWGEVMTPIGQIRFGRMGDHWGLGMQYNSGNGLNQDFGDSVDRLMFVAKINDWLIAPAFDFPNEGISSSDASGRPFDVSQLDDSYRILGMFAYKHDQEKQNAMLKRGDWLVNAGLRFAYQWQVLSFENATQSDGYMDYEDAVPSEENTEAQVDVPDFYEREMWFITPNLWFQFLKGTFHLELEAALIYGKLGNPDIAQREVQSPLTLLQSGGVLQVDYGLLSDALRIGLELGYAHGDEDVESIRAPATYDQNLDTQDDLFTAFAFNPAYNTDLILHHHILGTVSQSLYVKAFVQYDFLKNPMGRRLQVRGDVLYSRAIYLDSTIDGRSGNLGVELNAQVSYMSEDGFYAGFAYGVLFPMAAFKGDPDGDDTRYREDTELFIPQTVQMILGIVY